MAIPQKIISFLEKNKVKYETIKHRTVYTAFDKAATLKVKPNSIVKTLVIKLDREPALVLIPANKNLDKNKFRKVARLKKLDFASEKLIKNKIKGVKVGAIPPFGDLWNLPTFSDRGLFKNPKIIINSGDYNFSIKISPAAIKKLIPNLVIGNFSQARK
jgi:Ala-tRNA(Pro) deacylase